MADTEVSKASSEPSQNSLGASHNTASTDLKKSNKSSSSPAKSPAINKTASAKASGPAKPATPKSNSKPGTPKSNTKPPPNSFTSTGNQTSISQKSITSKTSSLNKRSISDSKQILAEGVSTKTPSAKDVLNEVLIDKPGVKSSTAIELKSNLYAKNTKVHGANELENLSPKNSKVNQQKEKLDAINSKTDNTSTVKESTDAKSINEVSYTDLKDAKVSVVANECKDSVNEFAKTDQLAKKIDVDLNVSKSELNTSSETVCSSGIKTADSQVTLTEIKSNITVSGSTNEVSSSTNFKKNSSATQQNKITSDMCIGTNEDIIAKINRSVDCQRNYNDCINNTTKVVKRIKRPVVVFCADKINESFTNLTDKDVVIYPSSSATNLSSNEVVNTCKSEEIDTNIGSDISVQSNSSFPTSSFESSLSKDFCSSNTLASPSNDSVGSFVDASISSFAYDNTCNLASNFATAEHFDKGRRACEIDNKEIEIVALNSLAADNGGVSDSLTPADQDTTKLNTSETVGNVDHESRKNPESPTVESPNKNNSQASSQSLPDGKEVSTEAPRPVETKHSIRLKVWENLDKNNLVLFPRPSIGRIPHFADSPEAADKLATLEIFKKARSVVVNPDKPQAHVRFLTLEAGKTLLVPMPRLRYGLFRKILPPAGATTEQLKSTVTQHGIQNCGQSVGIDDKITIDLVVMGAVAVSKEGYRIGKGEGYADLEFALLMKMGAITEDTVVVTTVHDEQVFDELPQHLFKEHDVPVDFIVTPTKIFEVEKKLPKPKSIFWKILSNRRLQTISILGTIRDKEIAEGKDCALKEVDSDPEDRPFRRPFKFFRKMPNRRTRDAPNRYRKPPRESSAPPTPGKRPNRSRQSSRTFHRKPSTAPRSSSAKEQPTRNVESVNVSNKKQNVVERVTAGGDGVARRPLRRQFFKRPKGPIAFSIRVSGISEVTRVRDLKTALNERGVKPYDIFWEPRKGSAVLHFSKAELVKDKPPQILSDLTSVTVVEGFPAKLEIKLLGFGKLFQYEWRVNGNPITKNGHCKHISRPDGTAALVIGNVSKDDAGEYTVKIKNSNGEVTSKCSLIVEAKTNQDIPETKPNFVGQVEDVVTERNSQLSICMSIAGNPVPDVVWSRNDAILESGDRIRLTCDGNKVGLTINECKMIDAGEYKCKLTNHLGEAECSVQVTVNPAAQNNQIRIITKDVTIAMDDMIAALKDLKIKHEGEEDSLSIEPANPISRIESTGISAV